MSIARINLGGKKLEGDALVNDVRSGKTFMNADGGPLTGAMDLVNLTAGNIKDGVTIDGILGTLEPAQFYTRTYTGSFGTGNYSGNMSLPFIPKVLYGYLNANDSYNGLSFTKYPSGYNYIAGGKIEFKNQSNSSAFSFTETTFKMYNGTGQDLSNNTITIIAIG